MISREKIEQLRARARECNHTSDDVHMLCDEVIRLQDRLHAEQNAKVNLMARVDQVRAVIR